MAKLLTEDQVKIAQAWLHDVFVLGGWIAPKRAIVENDYRYMYGNRNYYKENYRPAAKKIVEAIKFRQVDLKKFTEEYDPALEKISSAWFNPDLKNTDWNNGTRKKPDMLARYIAWFCDKNGAKGFFWDDTKISSYEREQIKGTILGKALWEMSCFISQPDRNAPVTRASSSAGGNTGGATPANNGQPQNGFKSRGPLSSVAVDLISQPGQKEQLSGKVYCILGLDVNDNELEECAYIRPVEADQKTQQKYIVGATNKVLFGSAKGYGFCPCYFDSLQDANNFLARINLNNFKVNAKVVKATVGSKNALTGGYFKIGTEFGPCYISASKLNESLKEEVKVEECGVPELTNKQKWECIENAFFHDM